MSTSNQCVLILVVKRHKTVLVKLCDAKLREICRGYRGVIEKRFKTLFISFKTPKNVLKRFKTIKNVLKRFKTRQKKICLLLLEEQKTRIRAAFLGYIFYPPYIAEHTIVVFCCCFFLHYIYIPSLIYFLYLSGLFRACFSIFTRGRRDVFDLKRLKFFLHN